MGFSVKYTSRMQSVRTNIAHIIIVLFLTVFGFELVSTSLPVPVISKVALEFPIDAEEEEEK